MLVKLIYINLTVFLLLNLLYVPFGLMGFDNFLKQFAYDWLAVPSNISSLATRPWTLLSYMFLHIDFKHIFFNLFTLFFLGRLFVQFLGEKKLLTLYLLGGLSGALLFIFFFNVFPVYEAINPYAVNMGASAAVMAIVIAIGTYTPNTIIRLFFTLEIKLKFLVAILLVVDLIGISGSNSGGHIAHLGGAAIGYLFAKQWLKGKDISAWIGNALNFIAAIFKPSKKSKMKVKYRKSEDDYDYKSRKKEEQSQIDAILDKISKSGYDSLSKNEKELLFKASNRN